MVLTLQQSLDIFDFSFKDIDSITQEQLKKKYHILCLKYHPDKNNNINSSKFVTIKEAYDTLINYKLNINHKFHSEEQTTYDDIYNYFLSFVNIDNINKIINIIQKFKQKYNVNCNNDDIITLNINIEQLFSKDLYLYNNTYIPLWHQVIHINEIFYTLNIDIKDKNKTDTLFYIKIQNLPTNLKIMDNNDILFYCKDIPILNQTLKINICDNKVINVFINQQIIDNKYIILFNQGVPRCNKENVYDISDISNIIICFI